MRTLRRLADSPYFGRIDLKIEGENQAEPIYIGIASLMDENDSDFLIYDWRAPISSVYYDSEIGPVTYTAPAGTVKGVLENKRQYVFRRGELKAMFDTSLAIGDERLKESLGEGASRYMKTIVSTIQKNKTKPYVMKKPVFGYTRSGRQRKNVCGNAACCLFAFPPSFSH